MHREQGDAVDSRWKDPIEGPVDGLDEGLEEGAVLTPSLLEGHEEI